MQLADRGGEVIRYREVLGVVPAFGKGLMVAQYRTPRAIVALLHDDLRIDTVGWDGWVLETFRDPTIGLVGFGGAHGVGCPGMYDQHFDPMTLARHHFISNMHDAEAHGERCETSRQVAVLDGFSIIGRMDLLVRAFWNLRRRQVIHHAYDVGICCEARRMNLRTVFLPVECHHHGGLTAVGNPKYAKWTQTYFGSDQEVWLHAHRQVWEEYRDVLPFRVN
jgi:hypothetical protein